MTSEEIAEACGLIERRIHFALALSPSPREIEKELLDAFADYGVVHAQTFWERLVAGPQSALFINSFGFDASWKFAVQDQTALCLDAAKTLGLDEPEFQCRISETIYHAFRDRLCILWATAPVWGSA